MRKYNAAIEPKHKRLIGCVEINTLLSFINSKPTTRNCSQSILFYCKITLHVSGVVYTHHQEYVKL